MKKTAFLALLACTALIDVMMASVGYGDTTITITKPVLISGTTYTTGNVTVDDTVARQLVKDGKATYVTTPANRNLTTVTADRFVSTSLSKFAGGISVDGTNTVTIPAQTGTIQLQNGAGLFSALTVSTSLTSSSCGKIYSANTGTLVVTLPSTAAGCKIGLFNNTTSQQQSIKPATADKIWGSADAIPAVASRTTFTGIDAQAIINTGATAKPGDYIEVIGDGSDGWLITKTTGSWTL